MRWPLSGKMVEMEYWDAYDRDGNKIAGVTLQRGEIIPDGVYHLVSDVLLRHADGTILIMRRDPRKHFGGMWEATSGGSALAGESAEDCAKRELAEETGVRVDAVKEVGLEVNDERHTIYHEFYAETDCAKDSVKVQEGETVDYRWVTVDELRALRAEELVTKRMFNYVNLLCK